MIIPRLSQKFVTFPVPDAGYWFECEVKKFICEVNHKLFKGFGA
jgi:hypothetical protein